MINQLINLPTLNLADLDRLFLKISDFDAIKGFFVKISKPQFSLLQNLLFFFTLLSLKKFLTILSSKL